MPRPTFATQLALAFQDDAIAYEGNVTLKGPQRRSECLQGFARIKTYTAASPLLIELIIPESSKLAFELCATAPATNATPACPTGIVIRQGQGLQCRRVGPAGTADVSLQNWRLVVADVNSLPTPGSAVRITCKAYHEANPAKYKFSWCHFYVNYA